MEVKYMYKEKKQKGHLQVIAGADLLSWLRKTFVLVTITSIVFNCYFGISPAVQWLELYSLQSGDVSLIPVRGAKISYDSMAKKQNTKQKQCYINSIKTLKTHTLKKPYFANSVCIFICGDMKSTLFQ